MSSAISALEPSWIESTSRLESSGGRSREATVSELRSRSIPRIHSRGLPTPAVPAAALCDALPPGVRGVCADPCEEATMRGVLRCHFGDRTAVAADDAVKSASWRNDSGRPRPSLPSIFTNR
jgi:hypothetical protein